MKTMREVRMALFAAIMGAIAGVPIGFIWALGLSLPDPEIETCRMQWSQDARWIEVCETKRRIYESDD